MTDLMINLCTPAELTQVVALVNAAYRGQGGRSGWTSEIGLVDGVRITLAALRSELAAAQDARIFVLREAGELLACVRLDSSASAQLQVACQIGMLAVRPQAQDRGLGRIMLQHAELEGRARGARLARMMVVSIREDLIAWYERRGYRRTGDVEPFPYRDAPFGHPQRPDLEFAVLEKALPAGSDQIPRGAGDAA